MVWKACFRSILVMRVTGPNIRAQNATWSTEINKSEQSYFFFPCKMNLSGYDTNGATVCKVGCIRLSYTDAAFCIHVGQLSIALQYQGYSLLNIGFCGWVLSGVCVLEALDYSLSAGTPPNSAWSGYSVKVLCNACGCRGGVNLLKFFQEMN